MVRTLLTTDPTYEPGDGGYTNYVGGGYAAGSVDLSPYAIDSEVVHIAGAETITGQKKFGTDTDNSTFEADGTLKFNGAATVEDDINISLVPPQGGAAAPAIIAFNGDARLDCYAFSGTNAIPDEIHSSLEILHSYEEGSDISFHLHWYPTNATLGEREVAAPLHVVQQGHGARSCCDGRCSERYVGGCVAGADHGILHLRRRQDHGLALRLFHLP